jgi:mono/diheme cytochrome c family protein
MRKKSLFVIGLALASALAGSFWVITSPQPYNGAPLAALAPNPAAGEAVFWAAGCASCHMNAEGDNLVLSGGMAFPTQFGTFYAPNISPDPEYGIGGWSLADFGRALQQGVSPTGAHYYPALPYSAYAKMTPQDVVDLKAYLDILPPDATPSQPHDIGFPFNIRRSLGLWKAMFADDSYHMRGDLPADVQRGRYLVEALAHCAECHTPRNALGGLDRSNWMKGAPNPDGRGRAPDITPQTLGWSADEITAYLETGFTPEYDSVGGHMAHVVENMAKLPQEDRRAIAAYLLALSP